MRAVIKRKASKVISERNARPRVVFRHSYIYDVRCKNAWDNLPGKKGSYPTRNAVENYMARFEKEWRRRELETFSSIAKHTHVPWTTTEHTCYVVGRSIPFSDPLTIPVFRKDPIDYVVDVLTHELIHRNLSQLGNQAAVARAIAKVRKAYPKETHNVIIHILVHAVHELVYLDVFTPKRMRREKKFMSAFKEYKRAWEIVESVGAKSVLKRFLYGK